MGETVFASGKPALIGDVNCDDKIDLLDIEPFVDLLNSGDYRLKADVNRDGVVDLRDVQPLANLILAGN